MTKTDIKELEARLKKLATDKPIEWREGDVSNRHGKPRLDGVPRYREYAKEQPQAMFEFIGSFADNGRFLINGKLWPYPMEFPDFYYASTVSESPKEAQVKAHLSSIMETRCRSRLIAMHSTRYTIDGEVATNDDIDDAKQPIAPKQADPAEKEDVSRQAKEAVRQQADEEW